MSEIDDLEHYHIFPLADIFPHNTSGLNCACNPKIVQYSDSSLTIIHNSWDRREIYERLKGFWPTYEGFGLYA